MNKKIADLNKKAIEEGIKERKTQVQNAVAKLQKPKVTLRCLECGNIFKRSVNGKSWSPIKPCPKCKSIHVDIQDVS